MNQPNPNCPRCHGRGIFDCPGCSCDDWQRDVRAGQLLGHDDGITCPQCFDTHYQLCDCDQDGCDQIKREPASLVAQPGDPGPIVTTFGSVPGPQKTNGDEPQKPTADSSLLDAGLGRFTALATVTSRDD